MDESRKKVLCGTVKLEASIVTNSARYAACRFGSFTLDLGRGELLVADGLDMPLRPKSFALLQLLLENAGLLLYWRKCPI